MGDDDEMGFGGLGPLKQTHRAARPVKAANNDRGSMDLDDDEMSEMGFGDVGTLRQTYRAARPVKARFNEDSLAVDTDEQAAMGLG